jgi:ABC-2 type transport system permease protein
MKAIFASARAEIIQMFRSPIILILTIVQAITFLFLVTLFGLTGSRAPTAIINQDTGKYGKIFIQTLDEAHHSFDLRIMNQETANEAVRSGKIVSIITIPPDFSKSISQGKTIPIQITVDNVDVDMTDDIQRAIPSAIVGFGKKLNFPGIRVHVVEKDLLSHDTDFIPYLVVSGLGLDAFIISGILSAMATAYEFESGMIKQLVVSPVSPFFVIMGRILTTNIVSFLAILLTAGIVIFGYGVKPLFPVELFLSLFTCTIIFGCLGSLLGVLMKRTLPVASLIFALSLPLYIDSGALEPERFDGNLIWYLAHLSPIYSAVGILEHAFHGFQVTPESIFTNFLTLIFWAIGMLILTSFVLRKKLVA